MQFKKCDISCGNFGCEQKSNKCFKCPKEYFKYPYEENYNITNYNSTIYINNNNKEFFNCVKICPLDLVQNKNTFTCK
jgi:hypothetical protein